MYNVSKQKHETYGNIIHISIDENGMFDTPSKATNQARFMRRLWLEEGVTKVKLLIQDQIMTIKEMDKWSVEEYKFLPKCHNCNFILKQDVFTHRLCKNNLFCTQKCADSNYTFELDKLLDEEEIDYL